MAANGYQPNGPATNEVTPPNTGSNVRHPLKFKRVGIPVEDVGKRLLALNKAVEQHNMGIGSDVQYNLEFLEGRDDVVKCVTITAYFFSE